MHTVSCDDAMWIRKNYVPRRSWGRERAREGEFREHYSEKGRFDLRHKGSYSEEEKVASGQQGTEIGVIKALMAVMDLAGEHLEREKHSQT